MAHAAQSSSSFTGIAGSISTFSAAFAQLVANHMAYRTTRNELHKLSDRNLADLGLNRTMIDRVSHDVVFGRKN